MKIRTKLFALVSGLSLIIIFMFLSTYYLTDKQKNDGLVINLAGRQRMLSKKMTKEFLLNELEKQRLGKGNVIMMQKSSEGRIDTLLIVQIVSVVIGILAKIFAIYTAI